MGDQVSYVKRLPEFLLFAHLVKGMKICRILYRVRALKLMQTIYVFNLLRAYSIYLNELIPWSLLQIAWEVDFHR